MANREGGVLSRSFDTINYFLLGITAVIMLYPFWYVLMFSLSEPSKTALNSYYLWPQGFSLESYKYMISYELIYTGFKNSVFVTVLGMILALLVTLLTAYPLAIGDLKGKNTILKIIFFTMLFSGGMIPKYLVVRSVGLLNSLWALIILGSLNVYYLLIMMKFLRGMPISLIESAKIDGYNDIAILFKIVVPLSGAMLSSIALFYAVATWNSYLGALIYITDRSKMVLQVAVRTLFMSNLLEEAGIESAISTPEHFRMAAIVITIFPVLLIYPYIQRYFIKGVQLGSIKG